MSMDDSPDVGVEAEGDPDVGEVAPEASEINEEPEAPARSYVEVDDPDNRYVRVKYDGVEDEIPFSELQRGYSREASYTQKSQALAERAKEVEYGARLQQALQANPQMTLQILAQQYGLTVAETRDVLANQEPEPEYQDPLERQLAEERQARLALEARLNERDTNEQLDRAIGGLQREYNLTQEDTYAVVQTAYQMGVGPEAFPHIWKSMAFDRIQARVQAARDMEAKKNAETAKRTAAKQAAAQTVSAGQSAAGLTQRVEPTGNMTLRDAINAAFEAAGVDDF